MKIIGLDLSLCNTGWVVLNNLGVVVDFGTITPKKLRMANRLYYIMCNIKKILKVYKPDVAIIEGYAYSPNANMAFSIGELGGVIKVILYVNKIQYIIAAPKTVKKFFTGNGNASKDLMKKYAKKDWNNEFNTEHEVDAYAMALLGHFAVVGHYCKKHQQEAVQTVLKDKAKQNYFKGGVK